MKKLLILFLALVMVFVFAGCADEADVRGEQNDNSSTDNETTETESTEEELSLGTVNGLNYENKFIGIGCNFESSWTFYTDEEIKALNNMTGELAGEEYVEAVKDAAVIYDMMVVNENQTDNVNVVLEKLNALQLVALDIPSNFSANFSTIETAFSNMGYTNITHEISTVEIDGETFDSMSISAEISGVKMYQTMIAKKCNGYLAGITVTTYQENTTQDILDNFYIVK